MSLSYQDFLNSKKRVLYGDGMEAPNLPAALYPWQSAIVRWALRKGRAAVFADCGLGKTFMQVAWANALQARVLILAPLCVAEQTVKEGAKLGIGIHYAHDQREAGDHQLVITNYERLEKFNASAFSGVVLDESSILKAFDGKTRTKLVETFGKTKYRLCCTATPSPNDLAELGNHAEFLGLMTRAEFLATWFIKVDQGLRTTEHHGWRMKRHAVEPFYRWMASWAVALRTPADIGADATGYLLPPLRVHDAVVESDLPPDGVLFAEMGVKGIQGRLSARRGSLTQRVEATAKLVARPGQWIVWCGLNSESEAIARAVPDAVEVTGADSHAEKVGAVEAFVRGDIRVLVSKAKILGFGMNFQHCHQTVFLGLSDSYEMYYQCLRRLWRYGQQFPVDAHVVVSDAERFVVENVRAKEQRSVSLSKNLLRHMAPFEREELGA
jgi:superfamily II DNA or RNA helicase